MAKKTSKKTDREGILYDFEVDGEIKPGEKLLIFEDGHRERVKKGKAKDDKPANNA